MRKHGGQKTKSVGRKKRGAPLAPGGETGKRNGIPALVCILLAAAVLAVFGQTVRHEFVNYDDASYVYENPAVAGGLTAKGIAWAFTQFHASNWHPVTWLSHMLDCQLYGLEPGGHHLTNVLLHASTAILLFLVLRSMTGAQWCSAFVAALFALHPLRVESVAWVAERKDLLSGLFFMLTLWAYTRYAKVAAGGWRVAGFSYLCVVLFFALGLMSKPMLITLPFVLLLLDYWPLRRVGPSFSIQNIKLIIQEKFPLFLLSAASCAVTVLAQRDATESIEKLPLLGRLGNALVAYVIYLWQTIWPAGMAVLYPHPQDRLPVSWVMFSAILLAAICATVFALRRNHLYAVTGWLWYLGMLVPVIGLMQVGIQAHADRYTYLPQIGLFVLLAWGMADLSAGWRHRRLVCGGAAALVLMALAGCTWMQASYWRDSVTLWTRALGSTSNNAEAHNNLGGALAKLEKVDEAIVQYRHALRISPGHARAHNNLGHALAGNGMLAEAGKHFRQALRIDPDLAKAHGNLGNVLAAQGKSAEAIEQYRRALRIDPDSTEALGNLGIVLASQGKFAEAIELHTKALEIAPASPGALNNLAWLLATCPETPLRNGSRAVELATQADRISGGGDPAILDTLAAALAEAGRFAEAVETARHALDLAMREKGTPQADPIRRHLRIYESGSPFHEERRRP